MQPNWGDVPGWVEAVATVAGFGGIVATLSIDRRVRRQGERAQLKAACAELLALAGTVAIKLDAHRAVWSAWVGAGPGVVWNALKASPLSVLLGPTTVVAEQLPMRIFRSPREAETAAAMVNNITERLMAAGIAVSLFKHEASSSAAWSVTEAATELIKAYEEPKESRGKAEEQLIEAMKQLRSVAEDL